MRSIARILLLLLTAGLSWPASALAGGGGGGECYSTPQALGDGWIAVVDSCFSPTTMTVQTGSVVRWQSQAQASHTVTFDAQGLDSGDLPAAASFAAQFNTPGTYAYHCNYHPGMVGQIVATGDAMNGPEIQAIDTSQAAKGTLAAAAPVAGSTLQAAPDRTVLISVDAGTGFALVLFGLSIGAGAAAFLWFGRRREALAAAPGGQRRR